MGYSYETKGRSVLSLLAGHGGREGERGREREGEREGKGEGERGREREREGGREKDELQMVQSTTMFL